MHIVKPIFSAIGLHCETGFLVDLLFQPVDGEDNVLEDLLREGHGTNYRGSGQLHERWLNKRTAEKGKLQQ
jgi:hypothetical protein